MTVREWKIEEVDTVIPLYLDYYNEVEGGCWTPKTARTRLLQVLRIDGAFALLAEEKGEPIGFVTGYFKQYDDLVGYMLEEIVIAKERQGQGFGSALLRETERRVRARGAACIDLQAVNDERHERFYSRAGYHNAVNFVRKVKWLDTAEKEAGTAINDKKLLT